MLATALHQLGYIQSRRGQTNEALSSLAEAVRHASDQLQRLPSDTRELLRSSRIEADYANALQLAGRPAESLEAARAARRKLERLSAADPLNIRTQQTMVLVLNYEAAALSDLGDQRGAVAVLRESVEASEAIRTASPADQSAQIGVMFAHYALGANLLKNGDRAEGLTRLRDALGEGEAIQKASRGNDYIANQIASVKSELGEALVRTDPQHAEGCRLIGEALGIWDELARRSAVPGESGRYRKHFEAIRDKCGR
jgi:tetratricopeptide (TPR) repeat protein